MQHLKKIATLFQRASTDIHMQKEDDIFPTLSTMSCHHTLLFGTQLMQLSNSLLKSPKQTHFIKHCIDFIWILYAPSSSITAESVQSCSGWPFTDSNYSGSNSLWQSMSLHISEKRHFLRREKGILSSSTSFLSEMWFHSLSFEIC